MRSRLLVSKTAFLSMLLFLTQCVSLPYFPWYNLVRYGTVVLVGVYAAAGYRYWAQKKYLLVNFLALLFGGLLIGTSYPKRDQITSRDPFLAAIVFVALFVTFLLFMEIMAEKKRVRRVLNVFYNTALAVALCNDLLLWLSPDLHRAYGENYLVGTKFDVVYLHFWVVCLFIGKTADAGRDRDRKPAVLAMLAWTFYVGVRVQCSTGVVGACILLLLLWSLHRREGLFLHAAFYAGVQLLCFGFIFFCEFVLDDPTVETFIVDILGKNATMSGRANIYKNVPVLLTSHRAWMTGFGYATSYELGRRLGGFPDTQNGILEWIWNAGVPTAVVLVALFMGILHTSKKAIAENRRNTRVRPFLAMLYLLTILGTVEITMAQLYFAVCVCLLGAACERREEPTEITGVRGLAHPWRNGKTK